MKNNTLKIITMNIAKSHYNFNLLHSELKGLDQNIILTINESSYFQDLDMFGLCGWRHTGKEMSGLTVYISNNLRAYTDVKAGEFGFYGTITPPVDPDGGEVASVGFISTYRNPCLDTPANFDSRNNEYFSEISDEANRLLKCSHLVYFMGDLNCYDKRYCINDWNKEVYCYPARPAVKSFKKLMNAFPTKFYHLYRGVTHIPRAFTSTSVSQLDYMILLYTGDKYPKGVTKLLTGGTSDHFGICSFVNLPKFGFVRPVFEPRYRSLDTDYKLASETLRKILVKQPISEQHVERDYTNYEIMKHFLLTSTTRYKRKIMPKGIYHPTLVRITILQSSATRASLNGDNVKFAELEDQIRVATTEYFTEVNDDASQDRSSQLFYSWCRNIIKPVKCFQGKFVMRNSTTREISDEINKNYSSANVDASWKEVCQICWDDFDALHDHFSKYDFYGVALKLQKVPPEFKLLHTAEALLAKQIVKTIINTQIYPDFLKFSVCTLLPARSIFSTAVPVNKLVETFFNDMVHVEELCNFAYRKGLSCTSLLLSQFDTFSTQESVFTVNADLQKAFDTMSRKSVIETIDNTVMKNVARSWMDRACSGYFISWRGERSYIDRSHWNRGVEPGSVIGPRLFIKGLKCNTKIYMNAIKKNIFADDSSPIYPSLLTLKSDTISYLQHVQQLDMRIHVSGSKAISYMAFGSIDKNLGDLEIIVDGKPVVIKRDYSVKQLGLVYESSKEGALSFDLSALIDRVRCASFALQKASEKSKASTLISTVRTFVIPAISYGICVYYPIVNFNKKDDQIKKLRYWYCACLAVCCFESKTILGWSNRTRTLTDETETELKLAHLTGLPVLASIYQNSCLSHFPQVQRLHELGWVSDSIKLASRRRSWKFVYVNKVINKAGDRRVSPLNMLLDVIGAVRSHNLVSIRKQLTIDSELQQLEKLYGKKYSKSKVRIFQRVLTLYLFGKLECEFTKKLLDEESKEFTQSESDMRVVRKRARIVLNNVEDRPVIVQKILQAPN